MFDALRKRWLSRVDFRIYENAVTVDKPLECHSFTIDYLPGSRSKMFAVLKACNDLSGAGPKSMSKAGLPPCEALQWATNQLKDLCHGLPNLPGAYGHGLRNFANRSDS